MSDPGIFVDESFRTPQGQSTTTLEEETVSDGGASPELTTRSGRKRRIASQPLKTSGKKTKMSKPATSAEIEALLKATMGGMESRLGGKLGDLEEKVGQTGADLRKLEARVCHNESRTDERLDRLERMIGSKQVDALPAPGISSALSTISTDTFHTAPSSLSSSSAEAQARDAQRCESYWHCRKSLRIWPVCGPDMAAGVLSFLEKEIRFEPGDVQATDFTVERFHENKRHGQKKKEVIVTFNSISLRDAVRAGAYHLTKEAGMRIHVPDFLKANFRHLDGVCYDLKQKFPTLKRNIKFDDDAMDLYADVQLTPDSPWKRLNPADARLSRVRTQFVPERTSLTSEALEELLGRPDEQAATGSNAIPVTGR